MTMDPVSMSRDLRKQGEKNGFDWFKWLAMALVVGFSVYMFLWEFAHETSDLYKHAVIASEFDFTDLHSITSRLAYPLWHLCVSALFQLGLPLGWAAALMCTLNKALAYLIVHRLLTVTLHDKAPRALVTLSAFFLMFVTGARVVGINDFVYKNIGSPTVWHNPTQLAVLVTGLLCVPYLLHCWYEFERLLPKQGDQTRLPWSKIAVLAVLVMASLACKPTFMQAMIPAAAIFFLVEWIRHPKNSRFFLQLIAAFLPGVIYFLVQYLYYTGVVVPFTSGVAFGATWESVGQALLKMGLMSVFPLFAVLCCYRKGFFKDKAVVLCLLMVGVSVLEAAFFRETGVREDHGNFFWSCMSSSFMLWVVMLAKFIGAVSDFRKERPALLASSGPEAARIRLLTHLRSFGFFAGFALLLWHVYSSGYYIRFLFLSKNAF